MSAQESERGSVEMDEDELSEEEEHDEELQDGIGSHKNLVHWRALLFKKSNMLSIQVFNINVNHQFKIWVFIK